jgi:hypothetical protein
VVVEVGHAQQQPDLGGDAAEGGHPLPLDHAQRIAGPPARQHVQPRTRSQVPGQLGADADVAELRRRQHRPATAPVVGGGAEVDGADGLDLALGERGPLRLAGRARCEHDVGDALGVGRRQRWGSGANAIRGRQVGQHQVGRQPLEHRRPLGWRRPRVDARHHRAQPRHGGGRDHPLGVRGEVDGDDRALAEAGGDEGGRGGRRSLVERGVGQRLAALDDHGALVTEPPRRLLDDTRQDGHERTVTGPGRAGACGWRSRA